MERLRELPGTASVTVSGERITAIGEDSDALARALLVDLGGSNLEVTKASLDAAFMAITGGSTGEDDTREDSTTTEEDR